MSTENTILNLKTIVEIKPLTISEALFSTTILEMAKCVSEVKCSIKYMIGDISLLTGIKIEDCDVLADLAVTIWRKLGVTVLEEIDEPKLMQVGAELLGIDFDEIEAVLMFFHTSIKLTDESSLVDSLVWGIGHLNDSLAFHTYYDLDRNSRLEFNQSLRNGDIGEDDPFPTDIPILVRLITEECDNILITSNGNHNYYALDRLEEIKGVKHLTLEEDSFGPLICGVQTNNGIITYG